MKIDMLGQPCPMPVIEAKKALQANNEVIVYVDNEVATQNLKKMAEGLGYGFEMQKLNNQEFQVILINTKNEIVLEKIKTNSGICVMISQNKLGHGDDKLGTILIKGYIYSLSQLDETIDHIIFVNGGVRLACIDANTIDDLIILQQQGTKIMVCGTCLDFYALTEKLAVGEIVNMYDISEVLVESSKTINI